MERRTAMKSVSTLIAAVALCLTGASAVAQVNTPRISEWAFDKSNPFGIQGQKLSYLNESGQPTQAGKAFSEVLRGNGSRAGYVLSHGGLVPSSVRVSVGARSLRAGVDYYVDAANGSLYFAEPVRRLDTISVYYEYVEGQDGSRNPMGMPALSLNFRGTALNFGYGVSSANGLDFNTYGLGLNSSIGRGSSLRGLVYLSSPAGNVNNRSVALKLGAQQQPAPNAQQARNDHLITQDLSVKTGSATFHATYQDVGQYFNGFQAMRQANSSDQATLAEIGLLEREKGIQRLGFGAGLNMGRASNLSVDWNHIGDGTGAIDRQAIAYQGSSLNLRYSTQSVGKTFARFQGLREGDAAQLAKERGIKRTDMALGFAPGKGSQLGFTRSEFADASGVLSRQSLSLGGRGFSFGLSERKASTGFGRLADLTDAEKTALALDIRHQFDPNATAAQVTAKDKEQIPLEAGLTRRQMSFSAALNKQSGIAFNQASVDDGRGRIDRRTLNYTARGMAISYLDQTIGQGFSRLGSMGDFERSMFANERGIHRTSLGLNLALNKASSFAYSNLSLRDSAGGMSRQSLAYQGRGLNVRVNLADTAKSFARAHDLAGMSDAEKAAVEAERGFRRLDYAVDLTALRGVVLNTSVYQARNDTDRIARDVYRHSLGWTVNKQSRLAWLSEGNASSTNGTVQDGRAHSLLTYDTVLGRAYKLNLLHDTVATVAGGNAQPTVTTDFLHFETDRSRPANLMAETKRISYGNGRFENTTQFDANYRASKALGLAFNRLSVDRGKDPSADTNTLKWDWQLSKTLKFSGLWADTRTNNRQDATAKSFVLSGPLSRNLNFAGSYNEVNVRGGNVRAVSDVAVSNAKPLNLLGLKDTTFTFKYAATNDQHKQQSEQVAGRLQGMLGKNQVALEYGSALDPKGNASVSRALSFVSDRNQKLPLHFDVSYRAFSVNRSDLMLERHYNVDYRMDKLTSVTYTYASLPQNVVNGQAQPLTTSAFSLKRVLSRRMNLALTYNTMANQGLKTGSNKLLAMVSGNVSRLSSVQVGYSVDIDRTANSHNDGHTIQVGYDQHIDADHILALSTSYTMYRGAQPNAVQANIDFKTRF